MSIKFKNVYVKSYATVAGPYEKNGPLGMMFDKTYDKDLYCDADSFEKAEVKLLQESMLLALNKTEMSSDEIDLIISGDLQNQVSASSYAASNFKRPFMGVYTACATNVEALIIASTMVDSKYINNCMCSVSSHNTASEKQFRNPNEYGAPKPLTSTFTSTGGASIIISNEKSAIKIESATIGEIVDLSQKDPLHMGAVMAGAAANTISRHLKELKRDPSYYDLIVTGDLGIYGKEILKDYLKEKYNIELKDNYNDCGVMLYDLNTQKDVHAGGSGPVCSALVLYTDIFKKMKEHELKKVLMVATGALFNPNFVFQKENILSIANAISLEVI